MKKGFNDPKLATIVFVNGFQMIRLPNGDLLAGIIKTVVTDEVDEAPQCTATFYVNIDVENN